MAAGLVVILIVVVIVANKRRKQVLASTTNVNLEAGNVPVRNISGTNRHYFLSPAMWCITVDQFRVLLQEVERTYPSEDPSVYVVVDEIIKPMTEHSDESYALQLNPLGVPVKHFVTHAWAEGFKQFAQALLGLN